MPELSKEAARHYYLKPGTPTILGVPGFGTVSYQGMSLELANAIYSSGKHGLVKRRKPLQK
ncbi:hypothetical protein EFA69_16150 [Rufibacter immobilis]|uniref:Uncharacterized protein n=1 Tax=Rufibacter immobilis TaxID=1348778 RepID=A0A3M9MQ58_9BACT|nr:hypothetical protein [Rufibacter immobilis]RNI27649.1 hypothetical protein EFA69_16150 [Rufibacter immobilis]